MPICFCLYCTSVGDSLRKRQHADHLQRWAAVYMAGGARKLVPDRTEHNTDALPSNGVASPSSPNCTELRLTVRVLHKFSARPNVCLWYNMIKDSSANTKRQFIILTFADVCLDFS